VASRSYGDGLATFLNNSADGWRNFSGGYAAYFFRPANNSAARGLLVVFDYKLIDHSSNYPDLKMNLKIIDSMIVKVL